MKTQNQTSQLAGGGNLVTTFLPPASDPYPAPRSFYPDEESPRVADDWAKEEFKKLIRRAAEQAYEQFLEYVRAKESKKC